MSDFTRQTILHCIEKFGVQRIFKPGQSLHFQDDGVTDIFFIEDGIATATYYEKSGKETWVTSYGLGDIVGLENLHSEGSAQNQVTARGEVKVYQFKRTTFLELIRRFPELNEYVFGQLADRLRKLQINQMENHLLTKRGRVASEIIRLAEPHNHHGDGYIVSPKPVISDMALRLGIARETVSRTVSDLIKNQVIERSRNAFVVPDLSLLEAEMR